MDVVDLARWQFAITTVYHYFFVPVTIGLSAIVAGFQTAWLRSRSPELLRLTKFFGKLFTINFALGLVTGIVQEFQFGMNWSDYSRFVGDIFGAPLALEALLAFFLESTFLGLWIFGWDRIPRWLHLASMWIVHVGTLLSAYFILAANSWMQNPVGYRYSPVTDRAELTDFGAVLLNPVQLVTFPHVAGAAYLVGGAFVMGIGLWHLRRRDVGEDRRMYRRATRAGAWVTLVAALVVAVSGDVQGKVMTDVQPMKMAAAEALYESAEGHAPFSLLTIGSLDGQHEKVAITVPSLLSFLATGHFDGKVEGINELKAQYQERYGTSPDVRQHSDSYTPNIPLAYWTFRLMIGVGMAAALVAAAVLWATRRDRIPRHRWWLWVAVVTPLLPILGNSFGWIFTETGRQPWLVFGVMTTSSGVSPGVSVAEVITSMAVFTLLYGVLAVIEVGLTLKYVRRGADPYEEPVDPAHRDDDAPLLFAY
ncbi:cytochrome ubiquinol oxidase subunit I [Segeticoccus rhizosphaerae]|uniref:cytochrome ubiquinol oxidase subunit I n=1 Tax=Segeticoccus rhizosphaerae TaxID=1104777 RepID=UPI0010C04E48|nr:cytochrome ubiquinol oxidase subunit I [Ornithinicoccus soli]